MTGQYDFALANRAFELMSLPERLKVLTRFAELKFPEIEDRFFEAVEYAIPSKADAKETM